MDKEKNAEEVENKYRKYCYSDGCKCTTPVCQSHASYEVI